MYSFLKAFLVLKKQKFCTSKMKFYPHKS